MHHMYSVTKGGCDTGQSYISPETTRNLPGSGNIDESLVIVARSITRRNTWLGSGNIQGEVGQSRSEIQETSSRVIQDL